MRLFLKLCMVSFVFLFFSCEMCAMFKIETSEKKAKPTKKKRKTKRALDIGKYISRIKFKKVDFIKVGNFLDKRNNHGVTEISVERLIRLLQCVRKNRMKTMIII
ncbi:hypothetical protein ACFLYU_04185 [Candidatus Dependentiae bacterium]